MSEPTDRSPSASPLPDAPSLEWLRKATGARSGRTVWRVVASVVGAVAFGERLGAPGLLGAALILAGGAAVALQPET